MSRKKHFSGHLAGQSGVPAFPRLLMVEHRAGHHDQPGFHIYNSRMGGDYQRLRRRAARAARASRLSVAVVGSRMATELQETLRYCYHEAFSELNSIDKRRPMMPGLHDVNVKMAIMDKLMSFS